MLCILCSRTLMCWIKMTVSPAGPITGLRFGNVEISYNLVQERKKLERDTMINTSG